LIAASAASNFRGEISAINAEPMKRPGLAPSRYQETYQARVIAESAERL
jgi:hypothetical protein